MTKVHVKNGTAVGGPSLCESCTWAQIVRGYRDSDCLVRCLYAYDAVVVPFKVRECSGYCDRNRPTFKQMQELALIVNETTSAKPAGFVLADSEDD